MLLFLYSARARRTPADEDEDEDEGDRGMRREKGVSYRVNLGAIAVT